MAKQGIKDVTGSAFKGGTLGGMLGALIPGADIGYLSGVGAGIGGALGVRKGFQRGGMFSSPEALVRKQRLYNQRMQEANEVLEDAGNVSDAMRKSTMAYSQGLQQLEDNDTPAPMDPEAPTEIDPTTVPPEDKFELPLEFEDFELKGIDSEREQGL
jgi:hypothetical protein